MKNKCSFYDDGCGNGSYCSGMNAGPPSCKISKNNIIPKCNGNLEKCSLRDKNGAKTLDFLHKKAHKNYIDKTKIIDRLI